MLSNVYSMGWVCVCLFSQMELEDMLQCWFNRFYDCGPQRDQTFLKCRVSYMFVVLREWDLDMLMQSEICIFATTWMQTHSGEVECE